MSEHRHGVERVNGIELAYRLWPGPRRASLPPVLILHGTLQSGEGMRHLAESLALDTLVLLPDLRGRGESERPATGYDPDTLADDVAALLDRLDLGQVVPIGRQHGGLVAYHLAARRPDLVCGVVLGGTSPEVSETRAAQVQTGIQALPRSFASREDAEAFYQDRLGLSLQRAQHDIPVDLEATADGGYRWRHDLDIVGRIEAACSPRADWDLLARVACPAFVLYGQRGEIRPQIADHMVEAMARARAQMIYGAGRDVFLGPGAEQTQAAIQLFLRGLERDDS
jgi:pimeloyl-ACP methyl ester carboxylesterase